MAQKVHTVMKKKINVRFVPAPAPTDYEKDKLIVKSIPEGIEKYVFVMFVEGRLDLDVDDDFSVDFRKTCAVLLFTRPYSDEGICINVDYVHILICYIIRNTSYNQETYKQNV